MSDAESELDLAGIPVRCVRERVTALTHHRPHASDRGAKRKGRFAERPHGSSGRGHLLTKASPSQRKDRRVTTTGGRSADRTKRPTATSPEDRRKAMNCLSWEELEREQQLLLAERQPELELAPQ